MPYVASGQDMVWVNDPPAAPTSAALAYQAHMADRAKQAWGTYGAGPNRDNFGGLARLIGYGGDATQRNAGDPTMIDRGANTETMTPDIQPTVGAYEEMSDGLLAALQAGGYSYRPQSVDGAQGYGVYGPQGDKIAQQRQANGRSWLETAVPLAIGSIAGGAALTGSGLLGGSAAGGASSAGGVGAGDAAASLSAYSAANPVTMAQMTAGMPGLGATGAAGAIGTVGAGDALASLNAYSAANPVTAAQMMAGVPDIASITAGGVAGGAAGAGLASASPAPAYTTAAADSQLASSQLGITGAQAASAATAPATVNLGSLGGTMSTVGGVAGAVDVATQAARDATASGGLLSQFRELMKDPMYGRMISAGLGSVASLAGGGGGGSSGGGSMPDPGPGKPWTSSLQQGLLSPAPQQQNMQVQQPGGLLGTGQAASGAWRFLNNNRG
jgi:hypothetical protein